MSGALRVLLLDKCAADAEMVRKALDQAGMKAVLERVDSREAFIHSLRDFAPHVVLSDHAPTSFDAGDALKVLQAVRPTAAMILLSQNLDERLIVACLRAGAEGFVIKADLSRLAPAIEAALPVRRRLEKLSPRQLQVLRLVAEGHTTRDIARRLKLSAKTVETHRGELMKRLGVHDVVALVRYAVRVGLVTAEIPRPVSG